LLLLQNALPKQFGVFPCPIFLHHFSENSSTKRFEITSLLKVMLAEIRSSSTEFKYLELLLFGYIKLLEQFVVGLNELLAKQHHLMVAIGLSAVV